MFFTFPALVFTGVPSIIANASSTTALIPGILASSWAYRGDLRKSESIPFIPMLAVSLTGGVVGALLLLYTPQRTFDSVIPWLLLAATLLFTFGPQLAPRLRRAFPMSAAVVIAIQFFIGIYGGYFGGAIGILMLATWSIYGLTDIHAMNAKRTLLAAATNSIAAVLFIVARKVWWPQTVVMLAFAVLGGYIGAHTAKKVDRRYVRAAVSVVSVATTILFFLRRH